MVWVCKQYLLISARKIKLGHNWIFQQDRDPKHTFKVGITKWKFWSEHHKALTRILWKMCGLRWISMSKQGGSNQLQYTRVTLVLSGGMRRKSGQWKPTPDIQFRLSRSLSWRVVLFWGTAQKRFYYTRKEFLCHLPQWSFVWSCGLSLVPELTISFILSKNVPNNKFCNT